MRTPSPSTRLAAALFGPALIVTACGGSATPTADSTASPAPPASDVGAGTPAATSDSVVVTQSSPDDGVAACPRDGEEFETTKLYIEHNATDADTGVHGKLGGEAWSVLCVFFPDGSPMLVADPLASFDALAVADLLFESREPENAEVSIDEIRGWFPEGMYLVATVGHDGTPMVGEAWFTHTIPVEPVIAFPDLAEDAETAGDSVVPMDGLVVEWEPVTRALSGDPVTISGYEVIITDEEFEDVHGNSRPVYDVHIGPDVTSLSVPADFLLPATIYELEVLALEESGNQTISVGFFTTDSIE